MSVIVISEMEVLNGDDNITISRRQDGSHETNVRVHLQIV